MYLKHYALLIIFVFLITGCSGQASDNLSNHVSGDYDSGHSNLVTDTDKDGIADNQDAWPNDNTRPKISRLWGVNGELWQPDSRLPFVALAGYHEGKDELPVISRVVANVMDFGATNSEGSSNDTTAFQDAIAFARTQVSVNNPGVIYVPAGVYDVDEQLHLNVSGLVLKGAGQDQSIIRFTTGLIDDLNALGSDSRRRKLIVMGGNLDESNNLKSGVNWQQWDSDFSAGLDIDNLPKRGDFSIRLAQPLNTTLKQHIINQNYRIRLAQALYYGEGSETPVLASSIYGGPDFASTGSNGGIWVSQQFVVNIADDNQTLLLDRPLRFSPSNEMRYGGARIAVRHNINSWDSEEIGLENLTLQLPSTPWLEHFGTEGQGGIEMMSDNSWIKNVRLINADNGIEIDKNTFNNTIQNVTMSANRVPRTSGPAEHRYDAYGHHGLTLKGRDHMLKDFIIEVSFVHDVTMNNCHACVVMRGQAPQMNMDHHRQGIYSNVWTEINLGSPHRMWDSTGNPSEGFNSSAFNTYWNLSSSAPEMAYWPEDGDNGLYPQWGYHKINIVATDITEIPLIGDGNRPYPYHPDNAHLEVISQSEIWPQNIYEAQREAYMSGLLTGVSR